MSPAIDLCAVPLGKAPDGTWDLVHVESLETVTTTLQFCTLFLSAFGQFFPRAAIFLLYQQLFQVHVGPVRICIWIGLVFTLLINIPSIVIALAFDIPRSGETWDQVMVRLSSPSTGRVNTILGPVNGAVSVALDIFVFVLPMPIIARLHLTPRKKKQLLALFSTASL
ncbi:hypothetical protein PG997_014349 [Apiospora hydei]|uniref:Rhodopsin domain-containing protein n=1 Tax=Apiospora hydei TaxID=1337664 RepID=A0ABR1UTJ1_9PEZI